MIEPGFQGFDALDETPSSLQRVQHFFAAVGVGDVVELEVVTAERALNRGVVSDALADVARDWIGNGVRPTRSSRCAGYGGEQQP